jgi:hypothetical protein
VAPSFKIAASAELAHQRAQRATLKALRSARGFGTNSTLRANSLFRCGMLTRWVN